MNSQTIRNNPLLSGWRTIDFHRSLLAEKGRSENYRRAIFNAVKANDIVVDIGSGTGILAFFACQAGAKKVYAIERGKIVELAKSLGQKNDFEDRIVFIKDYSYNVELPERADVVVTETFETFGLNGGLVGSVLDARKRFLKKSGVLIPQSVELFIVPVELSSIYRKIDFWARNLYGVDLSPVRSFATNQMYAVKPTVVRPDVFISRPRSLVRFDLSRIKTPDVDGEIHFTAKRNATLHGIAGWFSAQLSKGISISNAPNIMNPKWNDAFFPLERPVELKKGERIRVIIQSANNGSVWRWQVITDKLGAGSDQSNFWGWPLSGKRT